MRVLSAPFDDIPVLLPKTLELLFMMTELFLTVPALRVSVRPVRKPLGMHVQGDLPSRQKHQRHSKKTPSVSIRYKNEWREHHGIIPVINPTDTAAPVLKNPGLERTEKQYADHVTHTVCETDQFKKKRGRPKGSKNKKTLEREATSISNGQQ